MRENHVKRLLSSGQPAVGAWLSLPSPQAAEYLAQLGFDWLVCDTEHNPMDIGVTAQMFAAMARTGTAPMVRIPWNTGENIKRVLDAGAWGIVAPMVNSRAEAELVVGACKYPPAGSRGIGGGRHAISFGTEAGTYYSRANDEVVVVLQIEHIRGVENADAILSVPGVDACFIGPNDLSASMGFEPRMESGEPRVVEAIQHVFDVCKQHGVAPGIHTPDVAAANRRIADGFQFVAVASELRYMLAGAREVVTGIVTPNGRRLGQAAGESVRY